MTLGRLCLHSLLLAFYAENASSALSLSMPCSTRRGHRRSRCPQGSFVANGHGPCGSVSKRADARFRRLRESGLAHFHQVGVMRVAFGQGRGQQQGEHVDAAVGVLAPVVGPSGRETTPGMMRGVTLARTKDTPRLLYTLTLSPNRMPRARASTGLIHSSCGATSCSQEQLPLVEWVRCL